MSTIRTVETDVLIVGCGPTGLSASISLAAHGVNAIAISRYPGTAPNPRAHITNKRTMEVFRDYGIESEISEVGYPLSWLHNNLFVTSMAGMEIARFKSYGSSEDRRSDYAAASPCEALNCQQHVMEPVLLAAAEKRGADLRFSTEMLQLNQTPEYVDAAVRHRDTGDEYTIRAKYVIAADGAKSTIAEQLGFEFSGQPGLMGMATFWLQADLTKHVEHRPAVIYWIAEPGNFDERFGTASLNNVRPWDEWIFVFPWSSDDDLPSDEKVLEMARRGINDDSVEITVKGRSRWQVNNVVASEYRKGRVFLAGDAAHRHPPTGGLGTNTSVQDAFNLSWKLAYVLTGKAGEAILDSYEAERRPVGAQIVESAIKSWRNASMIPDAIGLRDGQTPEEGWEALQDLYSASPEAASRRELLNKAIEQQKYRANGLGVELGQRYTSSAIVDDGTPFPAPTRDPDLYYEPTTHPGAYLPHAWIEHDRTRISTLDTVGHGSFTLVVGVGGDQWREAAATVSAELGVDLPVVTIGLRCEYDDVVGAWSAVREVSDHGALLVRPDRHIAWRATDMAEAPTDELRSAFTSALNR